jgi:hypothetical protein
MQVEQHAHGLAVDLLVRQEAPDARVGRVVSVVAHHQVLARRHAALPGTCTLDRAITCVDANGTTKLASVTTQKDASGSLITGFFTIQIADVTGDSCTGTYRVTYTRQ